MKQAHRITIMREASHYLGLTEVHKAGPVWNGKVALATDAIMTAPLRWRRPRKIFVNSMGDLFHEAVPDGWIDRVFAMMALCPRHTFQVLTKRAKRMRDYLTTIDDEPHRETVVRFARALEGLPIPEKIVFPMPNVWLGVSAEDHTRADDRLENLRRTPAAVRFISFEPLLGDVFVENWLATGAYHWAICGGESGPGARPMHRDWARSLRDQCGKAGVAFFFKQWGEWHPDSPEWIGKRRAGRLLDGREYNEFPVA